MPGDSTKPIRILVVDDDPFLASTLTFALQRVLPPESQVRTAGTLAETTMFVERERFDGLIVDHSLPDGCGAIFLRSLCNVNFHHTALFLISGMDPNRIEVAELLRDFPQVTFIEKPFQFEALADLVKKSILPRSSSGEGHYGLELFDLVQAYSLSRKSATLRILFPDGRMGMVAVRDGVLIHAALGSTFGQEALLEIARTGRGRIRIDGTCTTTRRTVHGPTEHVLLETLRLLDESAAAPRESPPEAEAAPSAQLPEPPLESESSPPPAPSTEPSTDPYPLVPVEPPSSMPSIFPAYLSRSSFSPSEAPPEPPPTPLPVPEIAVPHAEPDSSPSPAEPEVAALPEHPPLPPPAGPPVPEMAPPHAPPPPDSSPADSEIAAPHGPLPIWEPEIVLEPPAPSSPPDSFPAEPEIAALTERSPSPPTAPPPVPEIASPHPLPPPPRVSFQRELEIAELTELPPTPLPDPDSPPSKEGPPISPSTRTPKVKRKPLKPPITIYTASTLVDLPPIDEEDDFDPTGDEDDDLDSFNGAKAHSNPRRRRR